MPTHDELMSWTAATMAIASALVAGMVAAYHRMRSAVREEDAKDRAAQIEAMKGRQVIADQLDGRVRQSITLLDSLSVKLTDLTAKLDEPKGTIHVDKS